MVRGRRQPFPQGCFLALTFALGIGSAQATAPRHHTDSFRLPQGRVEERMALYHVPGVSVAVIQDGHIAWAKGYGVLSADGAARVGTETLFQAASISKAVTATAALTMVQDGRLPLDAPVNAALRAWTVPARRPEWAAGVTVRRLLSHTAGIGAPGYLGYRAGQPVPSLLNVLRGEAPATSPAVRVERAPGQAYRYSGGGYG
ncbi:serine hydrolase domain-containing protein [Deinococcus radiotolerans]|nr:serine hydrolase domain-containing protein [Deinococcus radiotolerans]